LRAVLKNAAPIAHADEANDGMGFLELCHLEQYAQFRGTFTRRIIGRPEGVFNYGYRRRSNRGG
jgi:hypothetical protein